jgi:hypothetical protein
MRIVCQEYSLWIVLWFGVMAALTNLADVAAQIDGIAAIDLFWSCHRSISARRQGYGSEASAADAALHRSLRFRLKGSLGGAKLPAGNANPQSNLLTRVSFQLSDRAQTIMNIGCEHRENKSSSEHCTLLVARC